MKKFDLELSIGLFIIAGIICLGYLSIKLWRMEVFGSKGYEVYALFSNSGGLRTGASIVIAGADVGRVKSITLEEYQARVVLNIPENVKIQEDAIASITGTIQPARRSRLNRRRVPRPMELSGHLHSGKSRRQGV